MKKTIGLLTSGGDAPGMNTAIRAVVRAAACRNLRVSGFKRGYLGLINNEALALTSRAVSGIINLGGTILKTARCEEMKTRKGLQKAAAVLHNSNLAGLVVIGGDGSLTGADRLQKISGIPIIGIPCTIDNDVAGTDLTIGFDTAVNTALTEIDKIRDTATSHERLFIVVVMGRTRGFIALEVGLASGAEIILVPEIKYDPRSVAEEMAKARKSGKTSSIIIMAEGAGDSSLLAQELAATAGYDVRMTVLGHVQRGGSPTADDRVLASLYGVAAVSLFLKGAQRNFVGIKGGRFVYPRLSTAKRTKKLDTRLWRAAKILSR
ncbi:MAG: 6-phosphofructokinase [Aigarchaeota archaeon]|nr:6-phosphofructokinase [Aigarchaeota archaeon]